jgi:hypothetical protein
MKSAFFPSPSTKYPFISARVIQHPPAHHPLDADYDSVVDENQRQVSLGNPFSKK